MSLIGKRIVFSTNLKQHTATVVDKVKVFFDREKKEVGYVCIEDSGTIHTIEVGQLVREDTHPEKTPHGTGYVIHCPECHKGIGVHGREPDAGGFHVATRPCEECRNMLTTVTAEVVCPGCRYETIVRIENSGKVTCPRCKKEKLILAN